MLLFNRGTAEVTCTDAGAFVVERARKLLFDSRCLERDVSLYRERKIGDASIMVSMRCSEIWMARFRSG